MRNGLLSSGQIDFSRPVETQSSQCGLQCLRNAVRCAADDESLDPIAAKKPAERLVSPFVGMGQPLCEYATGRAVNDLSRSLRPAHMPISSDGFRAMLRRSKRNMIEPRSSNTTINAPDQRATPA